jgi:hypothetical protein
MRFASAIQSSKTSNKSSIPQSSAVTILDARSSESGDTSNWVWSPWSLAVFRFGGLAASFGGVTWHDHKTEGSSVRPWSGSGQRGSAPDRGAMVALLSDRCCRPVLTAVTRRHLSRQQDLPDRADANASLAPIEVLAVDAARSR